MVIPLVCLYILFYLFMYFYGLSVDIVNAFKFSNWMIIIVGIKATTKLCKIYIKFSFYNLTMSNDCKSKLLHGAYHRNF